MFSHMQVGRVDHTVTEGKPLNPLIHVPVLRASPKVAKSPDNSESYRFSLPCCRRLALHNGLYAMASSIHASFGGANSESL